MDLNFKIITANYVTVFLHWTEGYIVMTMMSEPPLWKQVILQDHIKLVEATGQFIFFISFHPFSSED